MITVISFGYGHARAPKADVADVRKRFKDPHVNSAMRNMTGLDKAVRDNVLKQPGARRFIARLAKKARKLSKSGDVTIAIGCVGGRHRSVALAELLGTILRMAGFDVLVKHRDINKPVLKR